jgi:hypothetical protein
MRHAFPKLLVAGAFATALTLAATAGAAGTPVTFQLNWMSGGPNAGFEAALAQGFYKDAGRSGEQERCLRCGEPFASAMMTRDLATVERQLGFRYEMAGAAHYQQVCPRCRRALFGLAQGAPWRSALEDRVTALDARLAATDERLAAGDEH